MPHHPRSSILETGPAAILLMWNVWAPSANGGDNVHIVAGIDLVITMLRDWHPLREKQRLPAAWPVMGFISVPMESISRWAYWRKSFGNLFAKWWGVQSG